ncbi:hypothetical protein EDB81DRAFT_864581 [Dactylonectria macrodidyma]|uniref:BZIP domain-containing protein n=1 Tax=Dactylonectria macrodidyma TaxID=307937 RepID=A0A9P9FNX7_9HYPO|nr:hypothetical protein EDB81DRAFT_864581 [Dactylonectria macrodidyma]
MPRKHRTPESLALNRENQRRSRARHRELLEELQGRVRDYERRDAQATLDMQRVAREVAAENAALKALLANKGVASEEVEAHLQAARATVQAQAAAPQALPPPLSASASASSRASPIAIAPKPLMRLHPTSPSLAVTIPPLSSVVPSQHPPQLIDEQSSACRVLPNPQQPAQDSSAPESTNKMRCVEAAAILARLRGHPDERTAWAALGCSDNEDCVVRKSDLLQLMDEMT